MSAFVVSNEHISALIAAACDTEHPIHWQGKSGWAYSANGEWRTLGADDGSSATSVGRMLLAENIRSVDFRYRNSRPDVRDWVKESAEEAETYDYTFSKEVAAVYRNIPQMLCLLHSYMYQANETDDWEETEAYRFCVRLMTELTTRLDGYKQARWTI
jgi:hypothetical protein